MFNRSFACIHEKFTIKWTKHLKKMTFFVLLNHSWQIPSNTEMKKNSPISHSHLVILHAFNKRGFFAVPPCTDFSVRPIPFWVRRWYQHSIVSPVTADLSPPMQRQAPASMMYFIDHHFIYQALIMEQEFEIFIGFQNMVAEPIPKELHDFHRYGNFPGSKFRMQFLDFFS